MDRRSREIPPEEIRHAEEDRENEVDVLAVHRQAFRETGDPVEGQESGPWWFWAAAVAAIAFGGFYMGRYTGLFVGEQAVHAPVGPREMMQARTGGAAAPAVDGAALYAGTCAGCHQANGEGTAGLFPPLAGSEYVTGDASRLMRIVLRGLAGPVTVKGASYNGQMPPWQQMSDAELAAILTHIRGSWGNGAAPVTAPDVAAERSATASRTAPYTAPDLVP